MVEAGTRGEYYQHGEAGFDAEKAIDDIPVMKILLTSIEEGAIRQSENDRDPLDVDYDRIDAIAYRLLAQKTQPRPSEDTPLSAEFVIPEDFDMHRDAKEAMRYAMRTIHGLGILSLDKFRAVARFITPANTVYVPDLPGGGLFSITDYLDYLRVTSGEPERIPFPESKQVRDSFISVFLGNHVAWAKGLQEGYAQRGVTVDEGLALSIATRGTAGHELGHAITIGLEAAGVDIKANAQALPGDSSLEQLRKVSDIVRSEHLAGSFEKLVRGTFFNENLPKEQVAIFEQWMAEISGKWDGVTNAFFRKAQDHGIDALSLLSLDQQMQRRRDQGKGLLVRGLASIVYYDVQPYTLDEMKQVIGNHFS